jgi:Domain of unknown function (DUF4304)
VKKDVVTDAVISTMGRSGFVRKRSSWYSETTEAIRVISLQASRWGGQYYLNLGVWLKAIGGPSFAGRADECHIGLRNPGLDPETYDHIEREVLRLQDSTMSDDVRRGAIEDFLETQAIPFLDACGSVAGIRQMDRDGRLSASMISLVVRRFLGLGPG